MSRTPGIPSRYWYGNPSDLLGSSDDPLRELVIQRHLAEKAGPHYDIRIADPEHKGLHSWVSRSHPWPKPGGKILLIHQPVHSYSYKDFEGVIPEGYGKGTVSKFDEGQIVVTSASPRKIEFTTASKKYPERFVMVKIPAFGERHWLLINKTPTEALPYEKVRYKKIPAEAVDSFIDQMQKGDTLTAKLDGASSLVKVLKKGVELVSYRKAKNTGHPIVHTERFFHGLPGYEFPPELVGSVLKGEIYGVRKPRKVLDGSESIIPPQELGGILNATVANSLRAQKDKGIELRDMIYDIQQYGKKPIHSTDVSRIERMRMIRDILSHIPDPRLHPVPEATTPEEARTLWEQVRTGHHPLTTEGVVLHPKHGPPMKSKLFDEADVHITGTFPGMGKYQDKGIGGFTYSLEPGQLPLGRIGTGLSDELRQQALKDPEAFVGRVARIKSHGQFPSGAYRVPTLIAFHEDYPLAKTSSLHVLEDLGILSKEELIPDLAFLESPYCPPNRTECP